MKSTFYPTTESFLKLIPLKLTPFSFIFVMLAAATSVLIPTVARASFPDMEGKIRVSVVAAGLEGELIQAGKRPQTESAVAAITKSVAVADNDEKPAPESELPTRGEEAERPKIVTHNVSLGGQSDAREDFKGRILPADHMPAQSGSDQVSAEAVLGAESPDGSTDQKQEGGFENLFGWRRGPADQDENEEVAPAEVPETIISSPDDHPEPAPFDDEDLEIPAFLRRSANH